MNTIKIESKQTKIIAHRGLSGIERENTCPAFIAAANRSYFGIETDVHVTKDGKFVIMHDETTNRVTLGNHNINIEESDFSSVENIVLPDLDESLNRRDIKIPLLIEYIKICKKYNKICVLEVKNPFTTDNLMKLTEEIKKAGYIENVIFISFDLGNCINLRKILPENKIQWLIGNQDVTSEMKNILVENNLGIDIYYNRLTKNLIDELHSRKIEVNCWTCDSKEDAENLVDLGVDFITTDILE